jgi:protein phosphatase PTC7
MKVMVESDVGSIVVRDASDRITGFLTKRDVIKAIVKRSEHLAADESDDSWAEPNGWNVQVKTVMTPSKDLVYLGPNDTLEEARALLAHSGVRHLPILSGSNLIGVISPKDIARCLHLAVPTASDHSAKKAFVQTVMPHKGIPRGTYLDKDMARDQTQTYALASAVCNLPHPKKGTLGEDAFLLGPQIVGVADGVGSWWEHGVDPAVYAQAMMHVARISCAHARAEPGELSLRPQRVLLEAWHRMQAANPNPNPDPDPNPNPNPKPDAGGQP